jgi:DUF4097 and DUF4098 domain-containing protein YvlB
MKKLLLVLVPLFVLAVAALLVVNLALDKRSVETHTVAGAVREIVVRSDSGDVDLVPADGRVVVRETQHYVIDKPKLDMDMAGGVLTLDTHCKSLAFNCSTDLRITVPAGVKVSVDADSGDVEGRRVAVRETHIESDSGDVSLELTGRQDLVWAHTDSGSVDVKAPDVSALDAETDSGDVDVDAGGMPRRVVAHTDSGDVDVTVPRGSYAVEAKTDSGGVDRDARVSQDDRATQSIVAETDSGDVSLRAR